MPYFFEPAHYAAIAAMLKAGDVEASTYVNPKTRGIKVMLDDGTIVTWSNSENQKWGFTIVGVEGFATSGVTGLAMDVSPDDVALKIATFDYDAHRKPKTLDEQRVEDADPVVDVDLATDTDS